MKKVLNRFVVVYAGFIISTLDCERATQKIVDDKSIVVKQFIPEKPTNRLGKLEATIQEVILEDNVRFNQKRAKACSRGITTMNGCFCEECRKQKEALGKW